MRRLSFSSRDPREFTVRPEAGIDQFFYDLPEVRNRLAGYGTVGNLLDALKKKVTLNHGDTFRATLYVAGYNLLISQDGELVRGRVISRPEPVTPAKASWLALSVGGRILPAAERDRWIEEWTNQLSELTTRRARARIIISLITAGIPKLALTLRRGRSNKKRAWSAS